MIPLYIVLAVFLTVTGQILLKKAAIKYHIVDFFNAYIITGYLFFAITVIISYHLMTLIDMKYFTAIMSVNYIFTVLASTLFLEESMDRYKLFGTLLISIGVIIFVL
ncbi:MAG: hypothetical protein AB1763_10500 [Campylobacterota bacterium]